MSLGMKIFTIKSHIGGRQKEKIDLEIRIMRRRRKKIGFFFMLQNMIDSGSANSLMANLT